MNFYKGQECILVDLLKSNFNYTTVTVTSVSSNESYPIKINSFNYSKEGKHLSTDTFPSLFPLSCLEEIKQLHKEIHELIAKSIDVKEKVSVGQVWEDNCSQELVLVKEVKGSILSVKNSDDYNSYELLNDFLDSYTLSDKPFYIIPKVGDFYVGGGSQEVIMVCDIKDNYVRYKYADKAIHTSVLSEFHGSYNKLSKEVFQD